MNHNFYRIIFNKRRGQLMVVAETAQAGGKAAAGESIGRAAQGPSSLPRRCRSSVSQVAVAIWLALGVLPLARAQIIADPTAPSNQRPTVLSDSAGRPLVNIQTPSAAGLSRNTYRQFDVPTSGIVLNNSASNPWLANGILAKTILNEVNSTSPSYINGAITVNGAAAQVIVANPNGITVNGGSFVNANRATLTTGTAQVSNGALMGFDIRGGGVTIGTSGMNNSATPYTDIMSRFVALTGPLSAQNLGITTGLQTVAYDTGLISNQDTNTYAAGGLTIDTAALGGMYANNISILATEAGLGVRNQGTWQASGGQITVTADGLLQNAGTITAGVVSLATVKSNIENSGILQGSQVVAVSAGDNAYLYGSGMAQTAGSTVMVSASGNVSASNLSSEAAGGQLSISAGKNVYLNGQVVADKDIHVVSNDGSVEMYSSRLASKNGNATVLAARGINLLFSGVSGQNVHLETGAAFKDTEGSLSLAMSSVSSTKQTTLIATGDIFVNAPVTSTDGNVHIQAAKAVRFSASGSVTAGQHMSVMAGTELAMNSTYPYSGRRLSAGGNMLLSGNSIVGQGLKLSAGQDLSIEAHDGSINLTASDEGGTVSPNMLDFRAGKDLNVSAFKGNLTLRGLSGSAQNINLLSNGTTYVGGSYMKSSSCYMYCNVFSYLSAQGDIVVGSVSGTDSDYVGVHHSAVTAGGKVQLFSSRGNVYFSNQNITAGGIAAQGASVYVSNTAWNANGDQSTPEKNGNINVSAMTGGANFSSANLTSTGSISMHGNTKFDFANGSATANKNVSSTSALGTINVGMGRFTATDVLSFSSKSTQDYRNSTFVGGAISVFSDSGSIGADNTSFRAVGTSAANLATVSGQISIEAGQNLLLSSASSYSAATDLSLVQGQGDIIINPTTWGRGTLGLSQLGYGRNLTLATRNGDMYLNGGDGFNGYGSSHRVFITTPGSLTLAANNINLRGSVLEAKGGAINLTATSGNLNIGANKVTESSAGFNNTYWDQARLIALSDLGPAPNRYGGVGPVIPTYSMMYSVGINARAAVDMNLDGVSAHTWGQANFQSGGNLTTSGKVNRWQVDNRPSAGSSVNGWYQDEETVHYTSLTGYTGITLGAMGGHLRINGTNVNAGYGTASMQALGDVRLEAVMTDRVHAATSTGWEEKCFLLCKDITWIIYHDRAWRNVNAVNVNARDISIKAGNNVETYATRLSASNNLRIEAGDEAKYFAVRNQTDHRDTTDKSISFIGIRYDKFTEQNTTRISTPMVSQLYASNGNLTSYSGGDQLYQGTQATYYSRDIRTGVGDKARADARIILEGVKTSVFQQRTQDSNYVVWQKQVNQGSNTETLTLPSFTGKVNTPFQAPGGISVQIPDGDFKSHIATLSQQPGMGYLNDLSLRTDVNWQPVKLAHDTWDYKQEGLTPAGAALLSVAVAWATGGMGANLLGTTGATTTAVANAAFTSLAATASITLINNKGDIGKTLKELGSSQTVKATIAAALTAGVLDKIGGTAAMKDLAGKTGFSEKLTYNLINATGRALTNTAINGGNLEDALKQALVGGLVDTLHGQVASQIKGLESDYLAHKLAHALAGCVAGAAASGTCKDGAVGAAVGEIVAEMFKGQKPGVYATDAERDSYDQKVLAYSKLVAGAVSAYAGGNAQTAITTAETAVRNNYLNHNKTRMLGLSEMEQYNQASTACQGGDAAACTRRDNLVDLSRQRDLALQNACGSGPTANAVTCNALANEATRMGNVVSGEFGAYVWANSPNKNFALNIATMSAPSRPSNFQDALARSTATALMLTVSGPEDLIVGSAVAIGGRVAVVVMDGGKKALQFANDLIVRADNIDWKAGGRLPDLPVGAVPGVDSRTGVLMMKLPNGSVLPWTPTNAVSTAPVLKTTDGSSIWVADIAVRGAKGEALLGRQERGIGLHNNEAVIDVWDPASGLAVSQKTLNWNADGYASNPSSMETTLKGYVNDVLGYQGTNGKALIGLTLKIEPQQIKNKSLELILPSSGGSQAQIDVVNRVIDYAQLNGIELKIYKAN